MQSLPVLCFYQKVFGSIGLSHCTLSTFNIIIHDMLWFYLYCLIYLLYVKMHIWNRQKLNILTNTDLLVLFFDWLMACGDYQTAKIKLIILFKMLSQDFFEYLVNICSIYNIKCGSVCPTTRRDPNRWWGRIYLYCIQKQIQRWIFCHKCMQIV